MLTPHWIAMKYESLSRYWKVPFRDVYCDGFRLWVAAVIRCHVVYRLDPPMLPDISGLREISYP